MNNQDEHDDNYYNRRLDLGGASVPDDAPTLDFGGADGGGNATQSMDGGNAFTRDMKESSLAVADGFDFPKGLPTSIKLKLHDMLEEHGVTVDNLTEKAGELATQIKPMLESGYDFVVNHFEALVTQVKTDAAKYLDKKGQQ